MTALSRTVIRPFYAQLSVERLSKLARFFVVAEKALLAIAALGVTTVIIQFAYPRNLTLPLQRVGGHYLGLKTTGSLTKSLKPYNQAKVIIKINNNSFAVPADKAGISIDSGRLGHQLKSYSWQQRLIPGSLLRKTQIKQMPTITDTHKQTVIAQSLASSTLVVPKNATLSRQTDGTYKLGHQITGVSTTEAGIKEAMKYLDPLLHKTVKAETSKQSPAITDAMLNAAIKKYELVRKSPLNLSYDSKVYTITPAQITAWSSIAVDETAKTATLAFDQTAIRGWLSNSVPLVLQQPGVSTVTIVNGVIQARSNAPAGTGIDLDSTVSTIVSALNGVQPSANANLKTLAPREQYVRQYTPTNEGLAAIINDWLKDYPGLKTGVALREIGGAGRQANLNTGTQYQMASVYKLFPDWYTFNQAEKGALNLDSPSGVSGKSIIQCIEASIVTSDNACGKWLLDNAGRNNVNSLVHGAGYGSTDLNNSVSTPNDTANFLLNLTNGALMNPSNTQTMLSYMQRQIYRSGIPAGSNGATVQNKVGSLGNIRNDAAIVRGHRSSYVLVIYTNSNNTNAIKDLANRIYALMQT